MMIQKCEKNTDATTMQFKSLILSILIILVFSSSALSVDFITREQYMAEESIYKDYPLKVLFQKFNSGDAGNKREIRNHIILKQVFDRNIGEELRRSVLEFRGIPGVIKEISGESLKIWLPETESYKEYYMGIDRIPLEADKIYDVSERNIGSFAVILYILDDRVYKVRVTFPLKVPTGLSVVRMDNQNTVTWEEPETPVKPDGYQVFINDIYYKTVNRNSINVPRDGSKADQYYVKAVYKQDRTFYNSEPSSTIRDETTLTELKQQVLAREMYKRILDAMNPAEWEKAKTLLYDNNRLLTEHLSGSDGETSLNLIKFFRDIDEGNRLSQEERKTINDLEVALSFYRRAEEKIKIIPSDIDLRFITDLRIHETEKRISILEEQKKGTAAQGFYNRIFAALNPGEWKIARDLLYDNRENLAKYFDKDKNEISDRLAKFFRDIDEGDRIKADGKETIKKHESALEFYRRARIKANELPENINMHFLPDIRIRESEERIPLLETENRKILAEKRYQGIISFLNQGDWKGAGNLLSDSRQILSDHPDKGLRERSEILVKFFEDIDEGDRLRSEIPETIKNNKAALGFYKRAEAKAGKLPVQIDMGSLTETRIKECVERISYLQKKEREQAVHKVYERILASLNPGEWETARDLLYDNREYLTQYLDEENREISDRLAKFFRDIDEGDRLKSEGKETMRRHESALGFYRRAREKAKDLPGVIDMLFLADLRIRESEERIALLETKNKKLLAQDRYNRIISALDQGDWETARSLLYDSRQIISDHLDRDLNHVTQILIEFFKDIDEGDRLSREKPESIEGHVEIQNIFILFY